MRYTMIHRGVTLLEVLISMAILVIMTGVATVVLRSDIQLARTRDAERLAEVRVLQVAISQYQRDNNGNSPSGLSTTAVNICQPGCTESSTQVDVSDDIDEYLLDGIPVDPSEDGTELSGYTVQITPAGGIIVAAPNAEREPISTQ